MNRIVLPGSRCGCVRIPASKSQAHRLLICAALGDKEVRLHCDGLSADIRASIACLEALGAQIRLERENELLVRPIREKPEGPCTLPCGESGSTLRFLLPVAGALGVEAVFLREGRLPERPLKPLDEQLCLHGMQLCEEGERLHCSGQLRPGDYRMPGDVSSQFISGLLLALPLLEGESRLRVTGSLESAGYVAMTEQALRLSGLDLEAEDGGWRIPAPQRPALPEELCVEADYSSAAFFLCLGALSPPGMKVMGLRQDSVQGDRAILSILRDFGAELYCEGEDVLIRRGRLRGIEIDASPIPDLIPVLSVVAAAAEGETRIVKAARLRLKESDRLRSTSRMLASLGAQVEELEDGLVIRGGAPLRGGTVDSFDDHRIAMAAAVAASLCAAPVTVLDAQCVEKSYPRFWEDFEQLTGGEA